MSPTTSLRAANWPCRWPSPTGSPSYQFRAGALASKAPAHWQYPDLRYPGDYTPAFGPEPRGRESETFEAFKERLVKEHGYFVKLRETRGADKMAACGQLGNVALRKRGGGGGARRPPLADVAPGVDLSW